MKPPAEIKQAHDLLAVLISGHWPIHIKKQDLRILEAQYQVLCWIQECEGNDCFKNSIDSLKDLIGRIRFYEDGKKYESQALVE